MISYRKTNFTNVTLCWGCISFKDLIVWTPFQMRIFQVNKDLEKKKNCIHYINLKKAIKLTFINSIKTTINRTTIKKKKMIWWCYFSVTFALVADHQQSFFFPDFHWLSIIKSLEMHLHYTCKCPVLSVMAAFIPDHWQSPSFWFGMYIYSKTVCNIIL